MNRICVSSFNPPLDPKKDPSRRCMRVDEWPRLDRQALADCFLLGDIFEPGGAGAGWAPTTRRKIISGYGRWLTWLQRNGLLTLDAAPGSRVTQEHVAAYFAELRDSTGPYTVVARIQELYLAAGAMAPDGDWRWIRNIERRLRTTATSVRNKRMRVVSSRELLQCGLDMISAAETEPVAQLRYRASRYRDGLIISFLAMRPYRRANLASIQIGRHLIAHNGGYLLSFDASETKSRTQLEAPFPDALIPFLKRYLEVHRPFLLNRTGRWNKVESQRSQPIQELWISGDGSAMSQMAIYDQIRKGTKARFGFPVNPHLFRDSAATTIATEDPERVLTIQSILGHTSMRTSEAHYNHARSVEALQKHQDGIAALRQDRSR